MSSITDLIKELRDKTGAGFLDCKKSLEENNNDIEKSIEALRKKGLAKASKKSDREANEVTVWFNSNNDLEESNINSVSHMHEKINQKKVKLSEIVKKEDIREMSSIGNINELDNSKPEFYSCNLFSKLQYDDLKKSYTETVIPVTNNDFQELLITLERIPLFKILIFIILIYLLVGYLVSNIKDYEKI